MTKKLKCDQYEYANEKIVRRLIFLGPAGKSERFSRAKKSWMVEIIHQKIEAVV